MNDRTCAACGAAYTPKSPRSKYCGACPCPVNGCTQPVRSLGVCANHVYRVRRFNVANPPMVCPTCGTQFGGRKRIYCSKRCRVAATSPAAREPKRDRWDYEARFVCVICRHCGGEFIHDRSVKGDVVEYCSVQCTKHTARARKRAREHDAYVEEVNRAAVFRRDEYRCHICGEPLDMEQPVPHARAAVIDHVIPLSAGGPHEMSNVAAAHFLCNSIKGDRILNGELTQMG